MNKMQRTVPFLFLLTTLILAAFTGQAAASQSLILATTTSTQDSGLLDALIPIFEKQSGYFVKTIAVGSGQAMAMGKKGEADVLLVHSPDDEKKFMAEGFGLSRRLVMHNDFVLVGPAGDPAKVRAAKTSAEAIGKMALFSCRGETIPAPMRRKGSSGK